MIESRARERLLQNIALFREELAQALAAADRAAEEITSIIVTKYQSTAVFRDLLEQGFSDFGESRVIEGSRKIEWAQEHGMRATWHLIGSLQKNKVEKALSSFHYLHSVDSFELMAQLSGATGKLFLQINPLQERSKHGLSLDICREPSFIPRVRTLLANQVCGLMVMAPRRDLYGDAPVHEAFQKAEELLHFLREGGLFPEGALPLLSMGMSQDFDIALRYGATHLRIGSRIFDGVEEIQLKKS